MGILQNPDTAHISKNQVYSAIAIIHNHISDGRRSSNYLAQKFSNFDFNFEYYAKEMVDDYYNMNVWTKQICPQLIASFSKLKSTEYSFEIHFLSAISSSFNIFWHNSFRYSMHSHSELLLLLLFTKKWFQTIGQPPPVVENHFEEMEAETLTIRHKFKRGKESEPFNNMRNNISNSTKLSH